MIYTYKETGRWEDGDWWDGRIGGALCQPL